MNWIKFSSVVLVMAPSLIFGFMGKPTEMLIALFAGFTSAVFINMDKFSSFKAGKLEAKLKEADEVIKEANVTIEEVKEISIPMMNYLLSHLVWGEKVIGMPPHDKEELYNKLVANFEKLDVKNEELSRLFEYAKPIILESYLRLINNHISNELKVHELLRKSDEESFRFNLNVDTLSLREELKREDNYNENVEEAIKDFERFKESINRI